MTGKLQIVLVLLYEGKVMNVVTVPFEYWGGGAEPWESLGTGLYTEDFICSVFGMEPLTYEVEIQKSTMTPGVYRMISPYMSFPGVEEGDLIDPSQPFNIEIDAQDPDGVILYEQPIGLDFGYGAMSIVSNGAVYLAYYDFETLKSYGYFGKLKDGVIALPAFPRKDSAGNPLYDEEGNPKVYQGYLTMGSSDYYGGANGAFKVVLPEAVTPEAKAKAKKMAKANSFARRLMGSNKVDRKALKRERARLNRMLPISKVK